MTTPTPILILNWNGLQDTLECAESALRQTHAHAHLYIMDNASEGDDFEQLSRHYGDHPKVTLIQYPENLGFVRAHNRLMSRLVQGDKSPRYIALLNNDAAAKPDWLENLLACAEETGAGMVSSKMVQYDNRRLMDSAGHFMLNTAEIIPLGHGRPVKEYEERLENFGACAGAALYRVEMLQEIGLFDEFFHTGYEDAELGARALLLGYRCMYEPRAVVYHKGSRSLRKVIDEHYLSRVQLNIFYTYGKLMPAGVLLINLPSFLFKYGSVLLLDVLFARWRYLRIMTRAMGWALNTRRRDIWRSRQAFLGEHQPISSLAILRRQTFFLLFDLRRFWKMLKSE